MALKIFWIVVDTIENCEILFNWCLEHWGRPKANVKRWEIKGMFLLGHLGINDIEIIIYSDKIDLTEFKLTWL